MLHAKFQKASNEAIPGHLYFMSLHTSMSILASLTVAHWAQPCPGWDLWGCPTTSMFDIFQLNSCFTNIGFDVLKVSLPATDTNSQQVLI